MRYSSSCKTFKVLKLTQELINYCGSKFKLKIGVTHICDPLGEFILPHGQRCVDTCDIVKSQFLYLHFCLHGPPGNCRISSGMDLLIISARESSPQIVLQSQFKIPWAPQTCNHDNVTVKCFIYAIFSNSRKKKSELLCLCLWISICSSSASTPSCSPQSTDPGSECEGSAAARNTTRTALGHIS